MDRASTIQLGLSMLEIVLYASADLEPDFSTVFLLPLIEVLSSVRGIAEAEGSDCD